MYIALAVFLVLHGFAHLVGFVGPWGLAASVAPQTALLDGRIPMGLAAMRVVGVVWAIIAAAFVIAAVGVVRQTAWWPSFTIAIAIASLVMSVLGFPQAKIGIAINVAIIAGVLFLQRNGGAAIPS
jgi:hypothetical protein